MTKQEFRELFEDALELAAVNAEKKLGRGIPRIFEVSLHGAGYPGVLMNPNDALDNLYLGDDLFYRIIDVAVVEVGEASTKVFVRASQHTPAKFEQTWNTPPGSGPFKQLIAEEIKVAEK
jgi:hypothetical protein